MDKKSAFLKSVLGDDGAQALERTVARLPSLDSVIIPYSISAWINNIGEYKGQIPGLDKSNFELNKNQNNTYFGKLKVADFNYEFQQSNISEVVAILGMVLDIENYTINKELKKINLNELNKSINSLIKFKLNQLIVKLPNLDKKQVTVISKSKVSSTKSEKVLKTYPIIKINKSELYNSCDTCGDPEFKAGKFVGCLCLQDLVKHELTITEEKDHFTLKFGKGWQENEDSISALLAIIKPGI